MQPSAQQVPCVGVGQLFERGGCSLPFGLKIRRSWWALACTAGWCRAGSCRPNTSRQGPACLPACLPCDAEHAVC
jgi:hypothetical protein